jgi:uncharacterized protein YlxP (DUF503 family)
MTRPRACCARIELTIPGALTLKDRRAVVRSILERLCGRFNVSAADLDGGKGGSACAVIGIVNVSNEMKKSREMMQEAVAFVEGDARAEVRHVEILELS